MIISFVSDNPAESTIRPDYAYYYVSMVHKNTG